GVEVGAAAPVLAAALGNRTLQRVELATAPNDDYDSEVAAFEMNGGAVVDVQCDSTAWATQLRLMRNQIVQMFARELGEGVVANIRIYGPNNGRWASRGPKRAPGGRGVRDTYG
ncbi:MAG: DciA family protein, partial [Rothia dentocariosa]